MKKIFALILMLIPALSVIAQNDANQAEEKTEFSLAKAWEIRTDGGITWGTGDLSQDRNGMATIGAMYHFNKNIAAGLATGGVFRLGHHYTHSIPVMATLNYRILGNKRLSPFIEAYGGYNFTAGHYEPDHLAAHEVCDPSKYATLGAKAGLEWAVLDNFGLRGAFNYNYFIERGDYDGCFKWPNEFIGTAYEKMGSVNLHKLGFNIGAYVTFGNKKKVVEEPVVVDPVYQTVVDTVWYDDIEYRTINENGEMEWVVFYEIRISEFNDPDSQLAAIGKFLAEHEGCKVTLKSYADRGTGYPKINVGYSRARSEKAVAALKAAGVPEEMMTAEYFGDTVQPFEENDKNRCTIIRATGLKPGKQAYTVRKFRLQERQVRVN